MLVPYPGRRRGHVSLLLKSGYGAVPEGRYILHDAGRGVWRASVVLPLRSCGAFSGDGVEEVLAGNPVLQLDYRHYVES